MDAAILAQLRSEINKLEGASSRTTSLASAARTQSLGGIVRGGQITEVRCCQEVGAGVPADTFEQHECCSVRREGAARVAEDEGGACGGACGCIAGGVVKLVGRTAASYVGSADGRRRCSGFSDWAAQMAVVDVIVIMTPLGLPPPSALRTLRPTPRELSSRTSPLL